MAREKKEKPPKKEKAPKEKRARKEKEQEETLLQKLMRQAKIKGSEEEEPEAEAAAEEQEEEAGGGKRRLFLLIAAGVLALIAVAVVVVFVILPRLSGGKEDPPPPEEPTHEPVLYDLPASYEVGEETVKGVEPLLRDGVQAEKDVRVRYTYTGMTDAGAEADAYVSKLKEEKFSVVDGEFVRTDEPDYKTAEGSVLLAKNLPKKETPAPEDGAEKDAAGTGTDQDTAGTGTDQDAAGTGTDQDAAGTGTDQDAAGTGTDQDAAPEEEQKDMVLTVELVWAQGTLTVTCDQAEGKVTSPPPGELSVTPGASMTMLEAVDFLYDLEPSVLGLDGTSMESYHIYAMDGAVLVDGQPCMRLNIYSRDGEGQTNEVAGIYLMSRDGQRLYVLDEEAKSVKELKLP